MTEPVADRAIYPSRSAAGSMLGSRLQPRLRPPVVIWGVVPTGVEIAAAAAKVFDCRFDVVVGAHVRMEGLGVIGAMAEDCDAVLDPAFSPRFGVMDALQEAMDRARRAIKTERLLFRGLRPLHTVEGSTVVIVDGHLTTAWKLLAAAAAAQAMGPSRLVLSAAACSETVRQTMAARRQEFACPVVVASPTGHPRPFGDPHDPSAERLRSIVVAREAA